MSFTRNLVLRQNRHDQYDAGGEVAQPEASLGETTYYFIGYPCWLFKHYAPGIYHALGQRVSAVITDSFAIDHSHLTLHGHPVPLITLAEFNERAKRGPTEVIFFFEHNEQFWVIPQLESFGKVTVRDYLYMLDRFGLSHTYLPLREERKWWAAQSIEKIREVSKRLGDERSRRTLAARIETITSGNRRTLMEVRVSGEYEYFNSSWLMGSLVPRKDEIYVDVGAAHGDTVDKFVKVTNGNFSAIHAFEPTPGQFRELATRSQIDPRIHTYRKAVGEKTGMLTFFDNLSHPLGGNAISPGEGSECIDVECVRLDDAIETCSLIKMDVEGFETKVLSGARRLISQCVPDLAITCYHYPQDLFEILDCVESIHKYRSVALRHYGPTILDSILLFSDRQSFD